MRRVFLAVTTAVTIMSATPLCAATTIVPQDNSSPGPTLAFTDGSATATFGASYSVDNTTFIDTFYFSLAEAATLTAGFLMTSAGGSVIPYKGDLDISFVSLMSGDSTLITFEKSASPPSTDKNERFDIPAGSLNQLFAPGSYALKLSGFADNVSGSTAQGGAGPGSYSGSITFAAAPSVRSAVPETSTWGMLLLGFGGLGFAMRRRKPSDRGQRLRVA